MNFSSIYYYSLISQYYFILLNSKFLLHFIVFRNTTSSLMSNEQFESQKSESCSMKVKPKFFFSQNQNPSTIEN